MSENFNSEELFQCMQDIPWFHNFLRIGHEPVCHHDDRFRQHHAIRAIEEGCGCLMKCMTILALCFEFTPEPWNLNNNNKHESPTLLLVWNRIPGKCCHVFLLPPTSTVDEFMTKYYWHNVQESMLDSYWQWKWKEATFSTVDNQQMFICVTRGPRLLVTRLWLTAVGHAHCTRLREHSDQGGACLLCALDYARHL